MEEFTKKKTKTYKVTGLLEKIEIKWYDNKWHAWLQGTEFYSSAGIRDISEEALALISSQNKKLHSYEIVNNKLFIKFEIA